MTPLDRILEQIPGAREFVLFLDQHLALIVGIPLTLFILFIFFWAFFWSKRKAAGIFRSLEQKGYRRLQPGDPQLRKALDCLVPFMFHTYSLETVRDTSSWRVEHAFGKQVGKSNRYLAMINRSVSRSTPHSTIIEHQFTTACLEEQSLPFNQDIHIAGDRYSLDPLYGLQLVDAATLGPLSSLFVVHTLNGKLDPLPEKLTRALTESAPFLSILSEKRELSAPFLFHARIRFTPQGWGLISNEFIYNRKKMDAFMETVERISRSVS